MKVIAIIGARPQFIKHYPFELQMVKHADLVTVHTGQHYDENMSKVFFDQLGMQKPDHMLDLGGGGHGVQTGKMLIALEEVVLKEEPDVVVVYGDTNSTLAGALVASKLHIPLVHIEAGLRSYNKRMPEEVNRVLTDHISDLLLVSSAASVHNLHKEGIVDGVHVVGDIMKDLLMMCVDKGVLGDRSIDEGYHYATLHRPYNVDQPDRLRYILESLSGIGQRVVLAAHPRTVHRIDEFGLSHLVGDTIKVIEPQPYFENLTYLFHARSLITDSGGMQKEAYWMEKPCTTIRSETEWVETLADGANVLLFDDLSEIAEVATRSVQVFDNTLYGDGKAAEKIARLIADAFTE